MIFAPFYRYETGCAAYLFGCIGHGKCAVVDPHEAEVDRYLSLAESKELQITHVIDTHVHADHVSGGPTLAERSGAKYCAHSGTDTARAFTALHDGDRLTLGNTLIDVRHTPGHTDDSLSLIVTDLRRGEAPWFVLTGDTLMSGAIGRPDLGGDSQRDAGRLYDSLHDILLALPDDLEVYPAHFAGSACSAGVSGKPSTTIGFEKRNNPQLSLGRDAFIVELSDRTVVPIANIAPTVARNRGRDLAQS